MAPALQEKEQAVRSVRHMAEARVRLLKTDRFRRQEQQRSVRFRQDVRLSLRVLRQTQERQQKGRLIQKDRHVRSVRVSRDVRHRRTDLQERELAVRIMRLTETVRAKEETAEMSLIVRQEATDRAAIVPQEAREGRTDAPLAEETAARAVRREADAISAAALRDYGLTEEIPAEMR